MKAFLTKHKKIIINILLLSYPFWGTFLLDKWNRYSPEIPPAVPSEFSRFYLWIMDNISISSMATIMMFSFLLTLIPLVHWAMMPNSHHWKSMLLKIFVILLYIAYLLLSILGLLLIDGK